MEKKQNGTDATIEALSAAAAASAQRAFDGARAALSAEDLDELAARAVAAASAVYRESLAAIDNIEEVNDAKTQLRGVVTKNPLAALGIAFVAGLLIALLTRG